MNSSSSMTLLLYTAKPTREWFMKRIPVFDCHANSPDGNPIENFFESSKED